MKKVSNSYLRDLANKLIAKPLGKTRVAFDNGSTIDIINEIVATDKDIKTDTQHFAKYLQGPDLETTLLNVWTFIKHNITYRIDTMGEQLIKRPSVVWHMGICDCKGYAIFISSLLKNLSIKHSYKFAGYNGSVTPTHVYVIVPTIYGYKTIDPCMPAYNKEKQPTSTTVLKQG